MLNTISRSLSSWPCLQRFPRLTLENEPALARNHMVRPHAVSSASLLVLLHRGNVAVDAVAGFVNQNICLGERKSNDCPFVNTLQPRFSIMCRTSAAKVASVSSRAPMMMIRSPGRAQRPGLLRRPPDRRSRGQVSARGDAFDNIGARDAALRGAAKINRVRHDQHVTFVHAPCKRIDELILHQRSGPKPCG